MANRLQQARDFDPYAKGVSIKELQRVRRQLAKVMNQRMVRLENTKSSITGESYTFGAYDLMSDYLRDKDRRRFSEVLAPKDMDKRALQKEIRVLQGFEELKSSRVAGMKEIENKRIQTFTQADPESKKKALHEEVVKSKDFYDFLNSQTFEELTKSFDSEKLVEEYDRYADQGISKDEIITALNEYVTNLKADEKISVKGVRRALKATTIRK